MPDLESALRYWQGILRLQDWDITAEFSNRWELPGDSVGCNMIDPCGMDAAIKVLNPDQGDSVDSVIAYDWEFTLVHELLHIVLDGLDDKDKYDHDEAYQIMVESTVNRLSKALTALHRKDGKIE